MSLRYALLALLSAEPMTGYDVYRHFDSTLAYMWHAPHTQIYPELRRMEADGLVSAEDVARGHRGRKRRYRVTDAGMDEFRRWINEPFEHARERDAFKLKVAYYEWARPEAARQQLRAHIDHHDQWREQWEQIIATLRAGEAPLLQRRLTGEAAQDEAIVRFKIFAYEGMVSRARAEIAWAERGLALIDELRPREPPGSQE
jgi:PadR family transcriptional regulator AphA